MKISWDLDRNTNSEMLVRNRDSERATPILGIQILYLPTDKQTQCQTGSSETFIKCVEGQSEVIYPLPPIN